MNEKIVNSIYKRITENKEVKTSLLNIKKYIDNSFIFLYIICVLIIIILLLTIMLLLTIVYFLNKL